MKPVREVVSRDIIDDLWGAGYTILPRARHPDPFHMPAEMVPQGRAYQWMHLVHDKFHYECGGWAAVPASRHDGYFMPAGFIGDIEVNGLGLFEKPKFEVDAERAAQVQAAHKQVDDWTAKTGAEFAGSVAVGGQTTEVGDEPPQQAKLLTAIPRELTPHILTIMAERDRILMDEEAANGPYKSEADLISARNAALLCAIETMRAALEVKVILAERGIEPENLSFCSDQHEIAEEAKRRVAKRTTKEDSDGQAS